MNSAESNNDVRLAATRALYNALGFAQANFSNDKERDFIMRVVCEATLSPEVKIRQAAFECLVSISSTYYEKLSPYIQDIFNITAKAMKEDEEPVALQAVEFWSSICDEEIDILEEYGGEFTGDSVIPCFYFIKQALPALIPLLLETLLKQEEDRSYDNEDETNRNSHLEEEKAIQERRFYLHPSPRRGKSPKSPPELLTLFPLTSPKSNLQNP